MSVGDCATPEAEAVSPAEASNPDTPEDAAVEESQEPNNNTLKKSEKVERIFRYT